MDRAWIGFGRILLFLGFGIAVLRRGWLQRRSKNQRSAAEDYGLLFGSALILTLVLLAAIYWSVTRNVDVSGVSKYGVLLLLFLVAGALTYGSNRILGKKKNAIRKRHTEK